MTLRPLIVLLGASSSLRPAVLSLEFHDGRDTLTAENVPVSRILDEWARRRRHDDRQRRARARCSGHARTHGRSREAGARHRASRRGRIHAAPARHDDAWRISVRQDSRPPDNVACSRGSGAAGPPPQPAPAPPQFQNRPDADVDLDEPAENPQGPPPGASRERRVPANAPPNAPPPYEPDEEPAQEPRQRRRPEIRSVSSRVVRAQVRINTPPPRNAPDAQQTPR